VLEYVEPTQLLNFFWPNGQSLHHPSTTLLEAVQSANFNMVPYILVTGLKVLALTSFDPRHS
jgi:hypothetical protein